MRWCWVCFGRFVSDGHDQNGLLILRQIKRPLQFAIRKIVAPSRVNTQLNGPEHDVGRRNAHIFRAGVDALPQSIFPILRVIGKQQHRTHSMPTVGQAVSVRSASLLCRT